MFYFDSKKKRKEVQLIKYRDEWGRLRLASIQSPSRLTDEELADLLQVDLITVKRNRRD